MVTAPMKISFVIPAFNEAARIEGCVRSVAKEVARAEAADEVAPGQCEIIVVNNASSDNTAQLALAAGARVVSETCKGLVWARAAGQRAAMGELVANIDADVLLPEGWLSYVVHSFDTNPNLVALSGPFIYYDLSAFKRAMVKVFYFFGLVLAQLYRLFKVGAMLQGGNFCVRREALERAGGYDTSIDFYGEDTDIAKRMSKVGRVKWTFKLPVYASGRRIAKEGIIRTSFLYSINFFWVTF